MSDALLRELEHRWRESGAVDDEARWLLERLRTGELPRERVELAAACGHEASLRCVPKPRAMSKSSLHKAQPREVSVALAMSLADSALETWDHPEPPRYGALSAVRAWLTTPTQANADAAREAGKKTLDAAFSGGYFENAVSAATAIQVAGQATWVPDARSAGRLACEAVFATAQALAERETGWEAWDEVRESVLADLRDGFVPWILGYEDLDTAFAGV